MRGSPPCRISVGRSPGWQLAVAGLAAAALAALLAWLAGSPLGSTGGARLGVALGAAGIVVAAGSALRHRPVVLRWSGERWSADFSSGGTGESVPGDLGVALDFGAFLLLVFRPEPALRLGRRHWIPVGRKGLEGDWHAFRCAVYSPPPGAGSTAADSRLP